MHLADSNRRGLGRGQLPVEGLLAALRARFQGPLVMERTAPGPNPFKADKGPSAMRELDRFLAESARTIRAFWTGSASDRA